MMKFFRIIGQVFPGWGAKQRKIWRRFASLGIESGVIRFAGRTVFSAGVCYRGRSSGWAAEDRRGF